MSDKIRIAIVGYGNVGRGVETACSKNPDMELNAVFTRRPDIKTVSGAPAIAVSEAAKYAGDIDVAILCGGSATDLDKQGPLFAGMFNTVDSFDTHARIPEYTIPVLSAVEKVRACENPDLSTREKHTRDCYVVAEEGADKAAIEKTIKTMPNYFADYDTKVTFISRDEMDEKHSKMPHGGFVLRSGKTSPDNSQLIEFSLKLDSNPEFTASVLVSYARAAKRLNKRGFSGARTVFDIAAADLSPKTGEELRKELL